MNLAMVRTENDCKPFRNGLLICLFLLWISPSCFAQVITIRVINITNGHPLQNQQVSISLHYNGERTPAKYEGILNLETNVKGEAQFELPDPPPKQLSISVRISEKWRCGCRQDANTQEVIQKGIVALSPSYEYKKRDVVVKAIPGEIIFPARPYNFIERLLHPLVKG
jgi:hypothetical protein